MGICIRGYCLPIYETPANCATNDVSSAIKLSFIYFQIFFTKFFFLYFFFADIAMDWSDHALWWPKKNIWLTRTRSTLDQYGVQADALLHFTPMHKCLRVQLPDLRYLDCRVDFSIKVFNAVINLCRELGENVFLFVRDYGKIY